MMDAHNVTLGEVLFARLKTDTYLDELYNGIVYNYALKLFGLKGHNPKPIVVEDALHFADLLSRSESDKQRVQGQEIVALLNALMPDDEAVKYYLGSSLANTGNYLGLKNVLPNFKSRALFDRFYFEFSKELTIIPADPSNNFFHSQKEVYDHFSDDYFSYSGPTSMSKSFVMRMFIKQQVLIGKKMNFAIVVPTKALINEVSYRIIKEDLHEKLESHNYRVVTSAGAIALERNHNFIFVLTPERLLYLLIDRKDIKLDYLFIDESHKISSKDSRSPFYYKTVDMLVQEAKKPHIVFSSPNIPNPEEYLKLIPNAYDAENTEHRLAVTYSPVSQVKFLIDLKCRKLQVYNDYTESLMDIPYRENVNDLNALIACVGAKAQNIVYCNSKETAVDLAMQYADTVLARNEPELSKLSKKIREEVHGDYYLAEILTKGVAYHIGYLPQHIREKIEELYRARKIKTIVCTSTLLEGVNLPADNLFITTYKKGLARKPMQAVDFKNLVGRVGRIQDHLYGNVFLVRLDEKIEPTEYVELLKTNVSEQTLSIISELTPHRKKKIIECLVDGDIELLKVRTKNNDDAIVTRKFAIMLLSDIMSGKQGIVFNEFSPLLGNDKIDRIKEAFSKSTLQQDDDINISVDQSRNLYAAIANGLCYPELDEDGNASSDPLKEFLLDMSRIFNWNKYESDRLGKGNSLNYYCLLLLRWVNGYGLSFIIKLSIEYWEGNPSEFRYNYKPTRYDKNNRGHKNSVIGSTLDDIEHVILFSLANYFLKFSEAYKKVKGDLKNDWYEYVEYGTTNPRSIMLQRNGFTRETADYIRTNAGKYVAIVDGEAKLRRSIEECDNDNVRKEISDKKFNVPDLFVD